jgi:hypothetical protein
MTVEPLIGVWVLFGRDFVHNRLQIFGLVAFFRSGDNNNSKQTNEQASKQMILSGYYDEDGCYQVRRGRHLV